MAEFKHIVRIANSDITGEKQILYGLTKIKGVDIMFANAICKIANIDVTKRTGDLADTEVNRLEEIVTNPSKNGIPRWMLNRREDLETGEDRHILGGDIKFIRDQDIKRMMKMKTYKGLRHAKGLTVRGQRTKSNFRRNKGHGPGVKKRAGAKTGKV